MKGKNLHNYSAVEEKEIKIHSHFKKMFYKNERKELLGKNNINLWILLLIFFITFCAIGFGNGSLDYLKQKMRDPFVNWVTIKVPYSHSTDTIIKTMKELNKNNELKERFSYENITGYCKFLLYFWDDEKKGTLESNGRTIDLNSPLLDEILNDKNKIKGRPFNNKKDIGLIVTEGFLKKFHYDKNTPYVLMSHNIGNKKDKLIPLPVIAVVKELPGLSMYASTPYFYNQRFMQNNDYPFSPKHTKDLILFTAETSSKIDLLEKSIKQFFSNHTEYSNLNPMINHRVNNLSYITGQNIYISLYPQPSINQLDTIFSNLINSKELKAFSFIRFYEYKLSSSDDKYVSIDKLSINFTSLDKIRDFKTFITSKYNLRIDMSQIKSKENYDFVSRLSVIISLILICFSILSICMFISNLLKTHLDKIKMNIGTFKAFGMDKKTLLWIYIKMIIGIIFVSMIISFIISWLFGSSGGIRSILVMFGSKLEQNQTYFQLFNDWTFISIFVIIIISFIVLYRIAYKILDRTPGDLIYNRV